jgi:hypothetical protein
LIEIEEAAEAKHKSSRGGLMRAIAGALLIVAAAIFLEGESIAHAIRPDAGGNPGSLAAVVLGLFGLILVVAGLTTDERGVPPEAKR